MLLSAILGIEFQKSGFKELPGISNKSQEELTSFLLIQVRHPNSGKNVI